MWPVDSHCFKLIGDSMSIASVTNTGPKKRITAQYILELLLVVSLDRLNPLLQDHLEWHGVAWA